MILAITGNYTITYRDNTGNYRYNIVDYSNDTGKLRWIILIITGDNTVDYRNNTGKLQVNYSG